MNHTTPTLIIKSHDCPFVYVAVEVDDRVLLLEPESAKTLLSLLASLFTANVVYDR